MLPSFAVNVQVFVTCYENNLDAFIPEQWAMESLAILIENMVAGNLVHRDFEMEFQKFGDVVNTRKPADFEAKRKTRSDNVTIQDATATNVAVPLDQHVHTSFLIHDGDETKSFKDLVSEYLRPAAVSMARFIDNVVLGQVYQYLANQAGTLGGLTNANGVDYITDTRAALNRNKAPMENRHLILTTDAETKLLQNATFHQADRLGDEGTALREASLGRKFGFNLWLAQNAPSIATDTTLGEGAVNNAAGYPVGTTVLTVDGFVLNEVKAGQWVTIGGRPYHVVADNDAGTGATSITLEYGLKAAVADNDVIKAYDKGAVNNVGGYAAGYAKEITIDGVSGGSLSVGQMVTFGTQLHRYSVIKTNGTTSMVLDRPLEAAIADNDVVNFGPTGNFNFAFHRNALALVVRPLKVPRAGTGAVAGSAVWNNIPMRTVITYDGDRQGHLVTLDFLAGIKVLESATGAVMLS